jgi:hypothetical protein
MAETLGLLHKCICYSCLVASGALPKTVGQTFYLLFICMPDKYKTLAESKPVAA